MFHAPPLNDTIFIKFSQANAAISTNKKIFMSCTAVSYTAFQHSDLGRHMQLPFLVPVDLLNLYSELEKGFGRANEAGIAFLGGCLFSCVNFVNSQTEHV